MNIRRLFRAIAILHFSLFANLTNAQQLTLDSCRQKAHDNYPAIRQYGLIEQSRDLTLSNAAKNWLPGVSISGMGMAMTDLIESTPMLGDMKNGLGGVSVTVNQVIYDGGAIGSQKRIAKAKSEMEEKQLDVQLYSINERVEGLFFGILMIDEQMKQVKLLQDNLTISEKTVKSLIQGGLANQSDLDQINVSQVQAEQKLINLQTMRKFYAQMLGYFIGDSNLAASDGENLTLVKPTMDSAKEGSRPELSFYTSQENLLDTQQKSLNNRLLPTVSAFGMATYHSTLMPIMKDHNLMAGVMMKWNVGALYTRKNDLNSINTQREQINVQRETFLFNNQLQQQQTNGQIESLRQQMSLDDKAVALRESILEKANKKVKLGTETVNELLRDVNAVSEARLQKAVHEIQLLQEINKLNTIKGR